MSYLIDPRSPFCVPDLSGELKQHDGTCLACEGSGHENYDDAAFPPDEPCPHCHVAETEFPECCDTCDTCQFCDGEGVVHFWCWYKQAIDHCDQCDEEEVMVAECEFPDAHGYICLPCYLQNHKDQCGCDLWKWAEEIVLGE